MEKQTVHQIVAEKNHALEQDALRTAATLIEQIAKEQSIIADAEYRISEYRKKLIALEVTQIDANKILGE